jgi:ribose 5-phosphate isomerase B
MKVAVGADDHSPTVDAVIETLRERGAEVEIFPTAAWPDVARAVGEAVAEGRSDMGVLLCWTGTGTAMMANKVRDVRAALCWEPWIAEGARRWNDANVLVMSLKRIVPPQAAAIVDAWLAVREPDPDERDNISKIQQYEQRR